MSGFFFPNMPPFPLPQLQNEYGSPLIFPFQARPTQEFKEIPPFPFSLFVVALSLFL